MVYIIYIAAAVAVGLLIGFVTLSIMWLRKSVSENIRSKTVGLLSIYDDLLEEKSRELTAVESEIKKDGDTQTEAGGAPSLVRTEASQPVTAPLRAAELLNMAERTGGATYRDDTVGDLYRKVRGNFSFHVGELLPAFGTAPVSGGPAGRLLAQLEFDTVYRLSTMPESDQQTILRECLPQEGVALLDTYLGSHPTFSVLAFYDHLRSLAAEEPKPACLHVPVGTVAAETDCGGVQIIPDSEICEGFQLEDGNFLYDYCIKARELR